MFPISSIELNFGSPDGGHLTIDEPAITVFVGPNNSGKSLLLRELSSAVRTGGSGGQVLHAVSCRDFTGTYGQQIIDRILREANAPPCLEEQTSFNFQLRTSGFSLTKAYLRTLLPKPMTCGPAHLPLILRSIMLDGSARLNLVRDQEIRDLALPRESFELLLVSDDARRRLRGILFEAFGKYLVVDGSQKPGRATLRYAQTDPPVELERSFTREAIEFFRVSTPIESMSDGVKAFTGILVELFAGDPSVLIIDEPEAFLHPSLAFLLGRELSRPASPEVQKNVFIATHSSSFLMGCVQSGAAVNVVRLTHSESQSTARLLDAASLRSLMRNPLLRSVGAIEALFYDYVVVTEADADRAFYDEINQRLVMSGDARGISNCLFLRAQNKQTVASIVKPLRALGIPAAGIVDIDIYEEGGKVWSSFIEAAGIDATTREGTAVVRARLKAAFDSVSNPKPKQRGGVGVLGPADRQAADNLFDQLDEHGMFTVRHGEVEHWLPGIAASNLHGPDWLVEAFKNMGEDSSDPAYRKPAAGDVWDFIGKIGRWLRNGQRKGL